MTDYSNLSDFEINKRVCDVFWPDFSKSSECKNKNFPQNSSVVYMENGYGGFSRDYCNSPADAWHIIHDNMIGVIPAPCYGEWKAAHRAVGDDGTPHHFTQHTNPLRAAMIVFLMMQEKK